tara:strand:+ start:229 stop:723 length:495 start_codon:yes stop_codon:yes gene_type:complete
MDDQPTDDENVLIETTSYRQQQKNMERFMESRIPKDSPIVQYERAMGAVNSLEWARDEDIPGIYHDILPYVGKEEAIRIIEEMKPNLKIISEDDEAMAPPPRETLPEWFVTVENKSKKENTPIAIATATNEISNLQQTVATYQTTIQEKTNEIIKEYAETTERV